MSVETDNDRKTAVQIAQSEADAQIQVATLAAQVRIETLATVTQARLVASQYDATSDAEVASILATARIFGQVIEATARVAATEALADARVQADQSDADARIDSTELGVATQVEVASRTGDARVWAVRIQGEAELAVATLVTTTQVDSARRTTDARTAKSLDLTQARIDADQAQSDARVASAKAATAARLRGAQRKDVAERFAIDERGRSSVSVATSTASNRRQVAEMRSESSRAAADQTYLSRSAIIAAAESYREYSIDLSNSVRERVSDSDSAASNYAADKNLEGDVLHEGRETDRLKARLALAKSRFDRAFLLFLRSVGPLASPLGIAGIAPLPAVGVAHGLDPSAGIDGAAAWAASSADRLASALPAVPGFRRLAASSATIRVAGRLLADSGAFASVAIDSAVRLADAPDRASLVADESEAIFGAEVDQAGVLVASAGAVVKRRVGVASSLASLVSGVGS